MTTTPPAAEPDAPTTGFLGRLRTLVGGKIALLVREMAKFGVVGGIL